MKSPKDRADAETFGLLTRRGFIQGAGAGLITLLASQEIWAYPAVRSPRSPFAAPFLENASVTAATPGGALQLPLWGDGAAWDQPEYYPSIQAGRRLQVNRTVQNADIDGDGFDELIARGPGGILVHKFDPVTGQWVDMPSGPAWSDANGWGIPKRYLNIMTADIDGDGQAELVGRNPASIEVWKYDTIPSSPTYKTWIRMPDGPPWQDGWAWDRPPYYPTIQCADIDGDGQDEILGRSTDASPPPGGSVGDPNGGGIQCWKYDKAGKVWNQMAEGPAWTDANSWNLPQFYTTIQCADVDGDGAAELLGRDGGGVQTWKYDTNTASPTFKTWVQTAYIADFNSYYGWNQPQSYLTLQCADIDGDGHAELISRAPDKNPTGTGIRAYKYVASSQLKGTWEPMTPGPSWTDAAWSAPEYYSTIQCADINADGRAELFARGPSGIQAWNYDPTTKAWSQLPVGPAWSDATGWNQAQYYSTIQTARVGVKQTVLMGRDSLGMKTWRFDASQNDWQQTSASYPPFTGNQKTAYDHITMALGIQLPDPNDPNAGIRYRYNDAAANINLWISNLAGNGPNPVGPPPGVPANDPDWVAVKTQILNELTWVINVNNWFVTLTQAQIEATFLANDLTLYTVGPYLNYAATDNTSVSVWAILALVFGGVAAILGFPELEAGAAAAVAGTIGVGFSAAADADPGGGWTHGFQANYSQLQTQLANSFTAAYTQSGLIPQGITGGLSGSVYTPGDYGMLAAIGQMIASTVWNWPTGNTALITASQRAYATSVFKFLFANYQSQADATKVYYQAYYSNAPGAAPSDFPPQYIYAPNLFGYYYWLQTNSPPNIAYPPLTTMQALFDGASATTAFPLSVPLAEFYTGQNGWQPLQLVDMYINTGQKPSLPRAPQPSLDADVHIAIKLTRDAITGRMNAAITLHNRGMTAANNVEITGAMLGNQAAVNNPPMRHLRLAPGRQFTHDLQFAPLPAGQRTVLKVTGRHQGGSFGTSLRVKLP